jgi:ketopantoate reductase
MLSLVQILKDGTPIAPSETIEFVDAVIEYCRAINDLSNSSSSMLDDLVDARADYSGLGIIRK